MSFENQILLVIWFVVWNYLRKREIKGPIGDEAVGVLWLCKISFHQQDCFLPMDDRKSVTVGHTQNRKKCKFLHVSLVRFLVHVPKIMLGIYTCNLLFMKRLYIRIQKFPLFGYVYSLSLIILLTRFKTHDEMTNELQIIILQTILQEQF